MTTTGWTAPAFVQGILLVPVVTGSLYSVLCLVTLAVLRRRMARPRTAPREWPPVSVLKPIYGLEKGLLENLRSTCAQDYPDFHVVFSTQRRDEPALPLIREVQQEFGEERVTVVVDETPRRVPNGKIRNLMGGLAAARHQTLVISDSDVRLRPDYLKTLVPPLSEPGVGCACTFYKAVGARRWYEVLEQLTYNADFLANLIFASVTGVQRFLLGASTAITRAMLEEIGGLQALGDYLVEDFEMGFRVARVGKRIVHVPYFVDTIVDLKSPRQWWDHTVYWDQNTRAANPGGLFATVLIRAVPFALLFALVRLFDPWGLAVLLAATGWRLATTAAFLAGIGDREGLRGLWLLPLRDIAGLASWALAFVQPVVVWRDAQFVLGRDGRMVPRDEAR